MGFFGHSKAELFEKDKQQMQLRIQQLEQEKAALEAQQHDLQQAAEQLRRQLEEQDRLHKDTQKRVDDLRREHDLSERQRTELEAQLGRIQVAKDKTQKLTKDLLVAQEQLTHFVAQAKVATVYAINPLRKFMEQYKFLHMRSYDVSSDKEASEQHKQVFFPHYDSPSPQQRELLKQIPGHDLPEADEDLRVALQLLNKIYTDLEELGKLAAERQHVSQALQASQAVVQDVRQKFQGTLTEYLRNGSASRGIPQATVQFSEEIIRAFAQETVEEKHIEEINEKIYILVRTVTVNIKAALEKIRSRDAHVFFPEFPKVRQELEQRLHRLFEVIVDHINESEKLAEKLTEIEDRELIAAQHEFNKFIRKQVDLYATAVDKFVAKQD